MKRETLTQHLFEHGRLTAYCKGERQVIWGVIADVNCTEMKIMNHSTELQTFEMKAIKGFRKEPYRYSRKPMVLQCDCGCKAEERYICEVCGKTFCGLKHGVQERNTNGDNLDLCDKCAEKVLNEMKE